MNRFAKLSLALLLIATAAHAQIPLQQSTASQAVKFGPFVDSTDGNTQETGLTIANTDIKCSKNGGTLASKNSGGGTHDANGWYTATLDATDTNTAGRLTCYIHVSGALPVFREFMVYPTANYAALFSTAPGATNGLQIAGTNAATTFAALTVSGNTTYTGTTTYTGAITGSNASNNFRVNGVAPGAAGGPFIAGTNAATTITTGLTANITGNVSGSVGSVASGGITEASYATTAGSFKPMGIIDQGTAQSATGTTLVLRSAAAFGDDTLIGATVMACGSTQGYCQSGLITDYVGSTDTATVATWPVTPSGTITYYVFGTAPSSGDGGGGTGGDATEAKQDAIKAVVDAILVDTGTTLDARIPAALVGGRMDATVDGTGMEAGAVTVIQSGLATAAALSTTDGKVDAVKAKTDSLTFTNAGEVDSNAKSMNDAEILGDGTTGDKWRGE